MVTGDVIDSLRAYARTIRESEIPVSFFVVFGSHATGRASEWSDIDVVVVSPYFDEHREFGASARLWSLTRGNDSRIEPIPCGLREWDTDDARMILEIARREGERVEIAA
jgi:predicted nucleotidyltransferase